MAQQIQQDSTVTMHFRLSIESGFVVEDTWQEEPLVVTLGDGSLIDGLESALQGLKAGDSASIELAPADAFGPWDDERIMEMQKSDFPEEFAIEEGKIIGFTAPSGDEVAGAVRDIRDDGVVVVDFNHPLAGKQVVFDVEILSVE